jgi:hypothetical protein
MYIQFHFPTEICAGSQQMGAKAGESAAILVQVFSIFSRDEGTLNFAKGMR